MSQCGNQHKHNLRSKDKMLLLSEAQLTNVFLNVKL